MSKLLIAPKGIEIKNKAIFPLSIPSLLIAPKGIEMGFSDTSYVTDGLLIAPKGIEIALDC